MADAAGTRAMEDVRLLTRRPATGESLHQALAANVAAVLRRRRLQVFESSPASKSASVQAGKPQLNQPPGNAGSTISTLFSTTNDSASRPPAATLEAVSPDGAPLETAPHNACPVDVVPQPTATGAVTAVEAAVAAVESADESPVATFLDIALAVLLAVDGELQQEAAAEALQRGIATALRLTAANTVRQPPSGQIDLGMVDRQALVRSCASCQMRWYVHRYYHSVRCQCAEAIRCNHTFGAVSMHRPYDGSCMSGRVSQAFS